MEKQIIRKGDRRPSNVTRHKAYRQDDGQGMDYREAIIRLLPKIRDEKLIRRVWRLLDMAYTEQ